MKQKLLMMMSALLAAGTLTASAGDEILVEGSDGSVTGIPLTMDTKITFTSGEVTVTNAEARVFPYAEVAAIRFKTESGIDGITADKTPFGLRENPVEDVLRITGEFATPARVSVTSLAGQLMLSLPEWNGTDIDVSSLPQGIYLITVNKHSLKFIKK